MSAELSTSPAQAAEGQAATAPVGTTAAAPETTVGQAHGEGSTATGQATAPEADHSFFDPKAVPPELLPAYKQMQGSYTKKMQAVAERAKLEAQKIAAYDAFSKDPVTALQNMAKQYGFSMTRAEAQAQVAKQEAAEQDWTPQTWDEVLERAEQRAEQRLMQKLAPVLQTVQQQQAQGIEKQLDDADPTWRDHEDEMRANLERYPHLATKLDKLLELSMPREVLEGRAMQAALKKLEAKTRSASVGGKSTTRSAAPATNKIMSFDESVQAAREALAKG